MSDLVKSLRETVLLVPMKNGGEMVTGLGEFAADRIEALEAQNANYKEQITSLVKEKHRREE